jgi:hypothetical protein
MRKPDQLGDIPGTTLQSTESYIAFVSINGSVADRLEFAALGSGQKLPQALDYFLLIARRSLLTLAIDRNKFRHVQLTPRSWMDGLEHSLDDLI